MAELLVVQSKLKSAVDDMRVSGDVAEALSKKVEEMLKEAAKRAKENKRSTIMKHDL